jgi:hypothetical protein
MTNHPLTDRKLFVQFLTLGRDYYPDNLNGFSYDDMRDVADWQLEQVFEWLKDNMRKYVYQDYYGADEQQEVFKTLEYLKLAMRPMQEENG